MKHLCGIFGKWIRVDLQVVDLCVDFLVDYSLILRFKMLPLIICIVLLMCRQVCRENQASSKLQGISTKTVQMSKGKCNLQSTIYITEIVSITLRKLYLYIYIIYISNTPRYLYHLENRWLATFHVVVYHCPLLFATFFWSGQASTFTTV